MINIQLDITTPYLILQSTIQSITIEDFINTIDAMLIADYIGDDRVDMLDIFIKELLDTDISNDYREYITLLDEVGTGLDVMNNISLIIETEIQKYITPIRSNVNSDWVILKNSESVTLYLILYYETYES